MRAAWYEGFGPAGEVLRVGELPDPEPGPGEVLVRLHASGVNPKPELQPAPFASAVRFLLIPHPLVQRQPP